MKIGLDGIPLSEVKTGVGHYTFELAQHLARFSPSDKFTLISHIPFSPSALADLDAPPNLTFELSKVNTFTKHWWTIGLPIYIKGHSLDLFHGTNYEVPLWGGCPTVLTIHDLSLLLYAETHENRRVRRARRRIPVMTRRATLIIVPTNSVKAETCEHLKLPSEKVIVVPEAPRRCFQPMPFEQATEVCHRLGIRDEFILYVGTIEPRKNILTLIRAFEEILQTTSLRPQLVLAGRKGWLTDELFSYLDSAKLGDRLLITGYVSDEDLRALYSTCQVMVFPALYEGAGLPPLEAMACGAPVVTSKIPAITEMVKGGARLASPMDHREFARQIVELLSDSHARTNLVIAGSQRASEFTWERTAQLTHDVYNEARRLHDKKLRLTAKM